MTASARCHPTIKGQGRLKAYGRQGGGTLATHTPWVGDLAELFGPAMPLLKTHPKEIHVRAKTHALTERCIWSRAHKPLAGLGSEWGWVVVTLGKLLLLPPPLAGHPTQHFPWGHLPGRKTPEVHMASTLAPGHFTHHTPQGLGLPTRLPAPRPGRAVRSAEWVCPASHLAWGLHTALPTGGGDRRPGPPSPGQPPFTLLPFARSRGSG